MSGLTRKVPNYSKQFWNAGNEATQLQNTDKPEFRVFNVRKIPLFKPRSFKKEDIPILPPRYLKQKVDQNWGNVWPVARSFHPATVPLPVRMGFPLTHSTPAPDKWGNLELMKIPNFLHLTPPVIKRQCEVLKKFCTPWPVGLETADKQERHFPVTATTTSYLHATTTIRDPRARIVSLKVPLKMLSLNHHSRDKLLRLVGERHNVKTDELTILADRCPLSTQNMEYCYYLLTVLCNEALKTEAWEIEKEAGDLEIFSWEGSPAQEAVEKLNAGSEKPILENVVDNYKESVTELLNIDENDDSVKKYGDSVLELIGLSSRNKETEKVKSIVRDLF